MPGPARLVALTLVALGLMTAEGGTATSRPASTDAAAYRAETEAWRAERETRLRAPDGWLSVVSLAWLAPGANRFGSASDNEIRLPAAAPAHLGTFVVEGGAVRLTLAPGVSPLTINGGPAAARTVLTDAAPIADLFAVGDLTWQVIARGDRLGVRVRDRSNPARKSFPAARWYPIAAEYRVIARLEPRQGSLQIVVPDAAGGKQTLTSPGTLTFTLRGKPQRLESMLDGDDDRNQLIVFRDLTSAKETYGAGRFVRAFRQVDGTFVIDFNRAYSPPCAITPHATCPLPPPENRLRIAVEAGEKNRDENREPAEHVSPASDRH
jgi:uncharacterized protein